MFNPIHRMNTTDEVAKYYYNPKIDKFGNDTNWYNDDYYEMIVVDKTATGYYYSLLVSLASKHPEVLEELISTRDYLESKT
jgi:hypothetical protein